MILVDVVVFYENFGKSRRFLEASQSMLENTLLLEVMRKEFHQIGENGALPPILNGCFL